MYFYNVKTYVPDRKGTLRNQPWVGRREWLLQKTESDIEQRFQAMVAPQAAKSVEGDAPSRFL
jgi:hypothetical protein